MNPYLSVVIPSFNELDNFQAGVLDQVLDYLAKQNYTWEVILSDDGSTDGTASALEDFARRQDRVRVLRNIHAGKAPTVRAGMLAARGQWRLFTDFDQSTPISEVAKLLEYAKKDYQVVIGSREMIGSKREREPFHRHVMGRGFNILVQILAIPGILDTQCGFKLFSAEATQKLFTNLVVYGHQTARSDAFTGAFDVELLFLAQRFGFEVREVPVLWRHTQTNRVNPLKDSLRMLRDIVRIRLAAARGLYPGGKD